MPRVFTKTPKVTRNTHILIPSRICIYAHSLTMYIYIHAHIHVYTHTYTLILYISCGRTSYYFHT